jgi:hypothetical protein
MQILARDAMLPIEKAVKLVLEKPEAQIKLKTDVIDGILEKDKDNRVNRLPILTKEGLPKYVVHRSTIDEFLVRQTPQGKPFADLTLQDMLNVDYYSKMLKQSFGTIRETSNLAEAKTLIDRIAICLDVFVTEDGSSTSKVVGWITNVMVTEKSKV